MYPHPEITRGLAHAREQDLLRAAERRPAPEPISSARLTSQPAKQARTGRLLTLRQAAGLPFRPHRPW